MDFIEPSTDRTTEIKVEYISFEPDKNTRYLVDAPDTPPRQDDLLNELKDQSRFLSRYNQRVREELQARRRGNGNGDGLPTFQSAEGPSPK